MRIVYKEMPERRFGVELEVSPSITKNAIGKILGKYEESTNGGHRVEVTSGKKGWAETRGNCYWHVKYDSTCGHEGKGKDFGWEIASYIGSTYADLDRISKAADYLHKSGLQVNRNCGLHIHVEARDLGTTDMGCLLARWVNVEDILIKICDPYRNNNKYCKRLHERWTQRSFWGAYHPEFPQQFWSDMKPTNLGTHDNAEKKYTLNTVGWAKGKCFSSYDCQTVELRLPECLLKSEHILYWASLMINFVEGCKNSEPPPQIAPARKLSEVLKLLNLQGRDDFFLLEPRLLDTKLWFLRKIVNSAQIDRDLAEEAVELIDFITEI